MIKRDMLKKVAVAILGLGALSNVMAVNFSGSDKLELNSDIEGGYYFENTLKFKFKELGLKGLTISFEDEYKRKDIDAAKWSNDFSGKIGYKINDMFSVGVTEGVSSELEGEYELYTLLHADISFEKDAFAAGLENEVNVTSDPIEYVNVLTVEYSLEDLGLSFANETETEFKFGDELDKALENTTTIEKSLYEKDTFSSSLLLSISDLVCSYSSSDITPTLFLKSSSRKSPCSSNKTSLRVKLKNN